MSSGIINRIAHHAWLSSLGLLLFASFIALGALPSGLTAPLARSAIGALRNWRAPQR
jgi:hypothetical protein